MITSKILKEFVEANPKLVTRTESKRYPGLFVVKYKRNVFYDNLWNDILIECRGLVVDKDYNIVVQPFTKIFNRFENGTDIDLDTKVTSIRKVNGFMACATYVEGHGVVVSTTGSLDSDFVALAEKWLTPDKLSVIMRYAPNMTFMFEIVDASDPHIVPEFEGAYLLGARVLSSTDDYTSDMAWESFLDDAAESMGVLRPEWRVCKFSDVVRDSGTCKHEGFVVYSDSTALKIKSPYYLMSKFLARKNEAKLIKLIDNPQAIKEIVDEEYYDIVDFVCANKDSFVNTDEQGRLNIIRNYFNGVVC